MTRSFSLAFIFEQKQYEAAIDVYEDPGPRSLSASVASANLHQLVPQSKEALHINMDEKEPAKSNSLVDRLKFAIIQAFKEHEKQTPPISLW